MNWITEALQRIGILPAFTVDEVLNAENEDALVDHRKVLDELTAATMTRRQITNKLRVTLEEAKLRGLTLSVGSDTELVRAPPK